MKLRKALIIGLIMSAAATLQACSTNKPQTPAQTTPAATTATETTTTAGNTTVSKGADAYAAGVYTATQKGYAGDVTVTVTVEGGMVTKVTAVGPDETDGVGTKALDALPDAIKDAQSADVDAIAGATVTSDAVIGAAKDALKQAVDAK